MIFGVGGLNYRSVTCNMVLFGISMLIVKPVQYVSLRDKPKNNIYWFAGAEKYSKNVGTLLYAITNN